MKQENITKGNVTIRRVLSWLLTLAMIISGFNMIPGTRLVANAASAMTKADLPTTAGSTLSDGKIYYVNSDTTITNSSAGGNGLIVENNATVAIHIAKGVTLTVKGGNGNGQTGGGAGIYVPATSTLIVAGEGTLKATGGNGGNGGNGEAGTDAVRTNNAYNCTTGTGGKGGYGAGGAGAAIGTAGGAGANQPTAQSSQNYRGNPISGAGGNTGLAGEDSNVSGNVYILGNVKFDGTAGSAGSAGTVPGASGSPIRFQYSPYYVHIGAGGGGGTGGATNDAATIGSGAPGAGSGGNGGNGGGTAWQFYGDGCYNGYGGNGGSIGGINGVRSNTYSNPNKAGAGGAAGAIGASGDAGALYVGPNANVGTLNSETATGENGYGKSSALTTLTSEKQYQILSDNDLIFEKQISFYNLDESANPDSIVTATVYGEAVSNIVIPSKNGYSFAGFYTEKNGKGIKIYDAKGKIATDEDGNIADSDSTLYVSDGYWVYPDNLSLYAYWTQKYNVTLNGNVGTDEEPLSIVGTTSIAIAGGEKVNSITLPTRKSYIFEGYFSAKDSLDDEAVKVFSADGSPYPGTTFIDKDGCWVYEAEATDVTLYASWLPVTTITFDKNAADATAGTTSVVVAKGEAVADIIVPTRSGWLFDGYNIENTSTKLFDKTGSIIKSVVNYTDANGKWISTANVTLKAIWTKTDGKVTFSNEIEQDYFEKVATTPVTTYNNVPEVKNITADSEVSTITAFDAANAPTRTGYTFAGFADELSGGTVVFDADGKIADKNITSKLNGKIVENGKWVYRGAITLYAQWTPVNYNFTFDKNTGDGNDVTLNNVDISNGYPATVTVAKQSKPGQQLLGFAATKDETADNLIYKASADDITIFNYVSGSVTTRPENLDVTLYAVWGTSTYQVAYYDRDWSTVAVDNASVNNIGTTKIGELQNMTYGEFMLKSLKEANNDKEYSPKFSGDENVTDFYEFVGWSTTPYAKKADYEVGKQYQGGLTTTPGEIVNLYAVWVKKFGADISFNGNGSLDAPATNIPADDEVIFDLPEGKNEYAEYTIESKYQPVREGYKFLGWSKSATDSTTLYVPGEASAKNIKITEDTVFYAQWKINPQVSYDANGGIINEAYDTNTGKKLSSYLDAQRYPAGTSVPVVNPREIPGANPEEVIREALVSRTGYTFVGWTVSGKDYNDEKIYSKGNVPKGETVANLTLESLPDTDIVFKAKWVKNTYAENIIADNGNDVYEISYTGTYNNEGVLTRLDGKPVSDTSDETPTAVTLTKEGDSYTGKTQEIPHDASIVLSVVVNGLYNAENVVVKVNNAVYKPAYTSVETVEETVAQDKQGKTTLKYRIDDITNASDFDVTISGAVKKNYTVQYKLLNEAAVLAQNSPDGYNAGETKNLLDPTDKEGEVNNLTFNGWYETKEAAELGNAQDKITSISTNQRGNKTYYAGWVGKKYTVTFNKLYGTTGGLDKQTATQEFEFGTETALNTISSLFDDTEGDKGKLVGPNGVAFLGWATSEDDAFKHKVTYTDGQDVLDIAKSTSTQDAVTLWAVWDIEKLTISFNANGGTFDGGKLSITKKINYGDTAADIVAEVNENKPLYDGFTFTGWAKTADASAYITTHDEKLYNDGVYYVVWNPDEHSFKYYTDREGKDPTIADYVEVTTHNGKDLVIGKGGTGLSTDENVKVYIPNGKVLLGWTPSSDNPENTVTYVQGEKIKVSVSQGTNLYPVFGDESTNTHVLTYNANGGTIVPAPATQSVVEEDGKASFKVIKTLPTRTGYTFAGWSDDETTSYSSTNLIAAEGTYEYNVPSENPVYSHVLYAIWKPITYTVTFNANKAPVVAADLINKTEADATAPKLIEESKRSNKISDATDTSYKQIFEYDKPDSFADIQYSYPGYVFKGWSETATGDVIYKDAQAVINMTDSYADAAGTPKNFTLYAIWTMDTPLTVTYRANGGDLKMVTPEATQENPNPVAVEAEAPQDQKYVRIADTMSITTAENVYVKDGYKFLGWSKVASVLAADATADQITAAKIISGTEFSQTDVSKTTAITLYAVWQKLPAYRVIYNLNAGAGSVPVDVNSYHIDTDTYLDDKIQVHNVVTLDEKVVPTRTGYTFLGWSTDANYKPSDSTESGNGSQTPAPFFAAYTAEKPAEGSNPSVPASLAPSKLTIDADTYGNKANNTINLYAIWQENTYKINFFKVDKTDPSDTTKYVKIGEQTFAYDFAEGKLTALKDMSFTPEVEQGQESKTYKYEATPGYVFAGWSFKAGGTLSLDDGAPIVNVLTGATDDTKEMNLYAVEKEKILTVTIKDDFETIGKNFIADASKFTDESFSKFYENGWGKVDVNIKDRAKDDKVVKSEAETASVLDKTGVDNTNHKYLVKYTKALNDITVPKAPGFIFEGYYGKVTVPDTSVGAQEGATKEVDVMYYDASGNAVKNADFTNDMTLTAKWKPIEFKVIFKENGEKIDEMDQTFGDSFKMPNTVRHLSYNSDKEVVGWTTSVDNQNPDTALIDKMQAYDSPDKFVLNTEYSAIIIAKLYNNYNADITMYPIYKTTRKYKVYFSTVDQKRVTNLPETQEVAWKDTFTVKFDDVVMRTPYREGYTFLGWSKTEGSKTAEYPYPVVETANYEIKDVTDNFTLYAVWQANTYKIAYYNGGETAKVEESVIYPFNATEVVEEVVVSKETPYTFLTADAKDAEEKPYFVGKPGYVLVGWSLDDKAETVDFALGQKLDKALATEEGDVINVYAVWSASTYNVTFNNNSENVPVAEGTMNNQVMTYDIKVALDKNQFTAEGYEFAGWSLDKDANVASFKDEENVDLDENVKEASVTLYAIWTPVIKATDKTEKYVKAGWNVTEMFEIPEKAGAATYVLTEAEGAQLSETNILTVTKPGTYEITVNTVAAKGVTVATAKANITVELADGDGTLAIMDGDGAEANDITGGEIAYINAANVTPVVAITSGDKKLEELGKVSFEYKLVSAGNDAYSTDKPSDPGKYIVKATVEDGTLYKGFTKTATYTISDKLQADGELKTYNGDEEATTFVEAKDTVVAKLTITAPTAEEDPEYKPEPKYTYKVAGTSDETYTDEVPTSAGKYTVRAVVEDTDKYIGFTKTANFEITAKQQAAGTVAIYIDDAEATTIPYADAAKITPKVTITKGDQTEANVTYEYKKQNAGDGTYTKVAPTEKGDYVVRATVADTDVYLGFTATAEFSISDKLQAAGTVATFNGELQTVEFMEAEGLVITPKMNYTVPEDAAEAEALEVTYTYKKAEASDSTYSDKQPTEIGEYTVRAVVAETEKYVGFTATANFKITEDPDKAEAAAKAAAIKSAEEDVLKRLQDTYETLKSSNKYSEGELAALEAAYNQSVEDIKAAIDDIAKDGTVTKSTEVPEKAEALLKAAKGDLQSAVDAQSKNEAADKAVADAVANADTVLAAAEEALKNENAIQEDKDKVTAAKQTVEAAKLAAEAAETNDAKNEAAKALQDAVDALDSAVDESNLHAAIAEAVMNQENIQPFVKKVATDSLKEYAERVKPDDLTDAEVTDFNTALETGKAAIEAATNNEEILGTDDKPGILAQQKEAVKAVADAINETRAANAAKEAAKVVAEMAEAAAEEAKANEYASDEDKKAIDDAKDALAGAMETLDAAETNEAKNAAADAVEKAAKALEDATDKANANSATARAQAEAEAAAKEAAEKALADAKTDAKKAIEALYDAKNLSDYRLDQQKELAAAKEAGDKAIDAAKTTDEVATELAAAKKAINAVKTDSAKTKEEDAAKKAADAAAAKAATDKINAIGTPVTENSKGAIDAARAAYNALTADQKKLVSNNVVKKLTDAEAAYNALVSPYDPVDTSKLTVNSATGSAKNGSIEGVDSTMQYSLDGKSWTDIADGATSITGFAAGKVYLRRKADSAHAASKAVTVTIKKINPEKPNFYSLLLHQHQVKKTSTILTWTKVAGAKKYVVYGGKYGAKMKKITSTTKNKVTRKGLKAGTMYNFYVVAIDAQGLRICTSDTVYIATKGGKLTNHKKITTSVSGKSTTISVGGTLNLNAKVTKESSKLQIKKINGLKYASTNPSIAKVSKKGVITGVKKGTCYVYVYAQNGVYKKIKVTVQ